MQYKCLVHMVGAAINGNVNFLDFWICLLKDEELNRIVEEFVEDRYNTIHKPYNFGRFLSFRNRDKETVFEKILLCLPSNIWSTCRRHLYWTHSQPFEYHSGAVVGENWNVFGVYPWEPLQWRICLVYTEEGKNSAWWINTGLKDNQG